MLITKEDVHRYERDGYMLVENMFSGEEIDHMLAALEHSARVANHLGGQADKSGKVARFSNWKDLGYDIWTAVSTSPRIVNTVRILLGEEIAFFGAKVMFKEAHSGGAWEWHQDFGYWYKSCVYPKLISVFIALDDATRENGCLRVLKGSHHAGRLQHVEVQGDQLEADPARVKRMLGELETVECAMPKGSALFFHCNLLHTSSANDSDHHRRTFITIYNAYDNTRIIDGKVQKPTPCPVSRDDDILKF